MEEDNGNPSVWREGKRGGRCCGPNDGDWMKDLNEYLNEMT